MAPELLQRSAVVLLVLAPEIASQSAAAVVAADRDALIQQFAALDFRRQAVVVRALSREVSRLADPLIERVFSLQLDVHELPDAADGPPVHSPAVFASAEHAAGRAPNRRPLADDSDAYLAVTRRFARPAYLPDLRREVEYDWQAGRIVRLPALSYTDLFANHVHGYAPGSDHAIARIQAAFDHDPSMRVLAAWFGHGYCDLEARSYPGVTLYDAWYSGAIVDVPDVDAIPFARQILGNDRLRSPLSGPPRDRLYAAIAAAALRYRVHRTTAEAAAAAFVAAAPTMDPAYALLVPRFHYLFAVHEDQPGTVAEILATADRDAMLTEVDAAIRQPDGRAFQIREARRRELAATADRIRALAKAVLERFAD